MSSRSQQYGIICRKVLWSLVWSVVLILVIRWSPDTECQATVRRHSSDHEHPRPDCSRYLLEQWLVLTVFLSRLLSPMLCCFSLGLESSYEVSLPWWAIQISRNISRIDKFFREEDPNSAPSAPDYLKYLQPPYVPPNSEVCWNPPLRKSLTNV